MMEFERGWEERIQGVSTPIRISPRRTITHLFVLSAGTAAGLKLLSLSLARQSGSFKIEIENEEMLENVFTLMKTICKHSRLGLPVSWDSARENLKAPSADSQYQSPLESIITNNY